MERTPLAITEMLSRYQVEDNFVLVVLCRQREGGEMHLVSISSIYLYLAPCDEPARFLLYLTVLKLVYFRFGFTSDSLNM